MKALKLAIELNRVNGTQKTASEIIQDAAIFEAFLLGDLTVIIRVNDGASNLSHFKSVPDFLSRSLKILKNRLLRKSVLPTLQTRISKSVKKSQDQVFTRSAHSSSSRPVSENARTDSTSEAGNGSVAYPAQNQKENRV